MKIKTLWIWMLSFAIGLVACDTDNRETKSTKENLSIFWLTGSWKRLDEVEGKRTYEVWVKKSDSEYQGTAWTLRDVDTTFYETMSLKSLNGRWQLAVTGDNGNTVQFDVVAFEKERILCENPANDFPKTIEYHLENDTLFAQVSDENTKVPFTFQKVDVIDE